MNNELNVDSIFCRAVEILSDTDRRKYLNETCGANVEIRERVEKLLAAHAQAGSFMADSQERTIGVPRYSEQSGSCIGPYKLRECLGAGGMGVVWAAEQKQPLRRKVALKIIKPGMDSEKIIARFEAERETLAIMDHPNIARVIDAGTTEQGRPYFVMELIHGAAITDYCDTRKLSVRERLELFIQVCRAVQHAHQKGVIHRDIKPSNVLVTEADGVPVPKVIDFGVAKALYHPLTDHSIYTGVFQAIGTLPYMSPEQATLGKNDVDTRADVYGLGVLLYELLTGSTPLAREQLEKGALEEALRVIREEDPQKPSTRISSLGNSTEFVSQLRSTDAKGLTQTIQGDLDWIIMKSLEKERSRRYETANDLADDISRALRDEPIEAIPPSNLYIFQKFVLRHRAKVAAVSAVIVSLILGLLGTGIFAHLAYKSSEAQEQINQELRVALEKVRTTSDELKKKTFEQLTNLAFHVWGDGNRKQFERYVKSLREFPHSGHTGIDRRLLDALYEEIRSVPVIGTGATVEDISYSADGRRLAIGCLGKNASVYDTSTRSSLHVFENTQSTHAVYSHDGNLLAVSSSRPNSPSVVQVFNVKSNDLMWEANARSCAVFSDDSTMVACASRERIEILDANTGAVLIGLPLIRDASGTVRIAFSPNGRLVAAGDSKGETIIWNCDTEKEVERIRTVSWTQLVAFSPNGEHLAIGGEFGTRLYRIEDEQVLPIDVKLEGSATCGDFSSDGRFLAVGCADHQTRIWDTTDFTQVARLLGDDYVGDVDFAPDGRHLAAGGRDQCVRIWDASHWERDDVFSSSVSYHPPLAVSPAGMAIFARDETPANLDSSEYPNGTSILVAWDSASREKRVLAHLEDKVSALACSHDNRWVASGTHDGSVDLWDLKTGERVHHFDNAHGGGIYSLVFSLDSKLLFSAGIAPSLIRWDLTSLHPQEMPGHEGLVWCLSLSSEGTLASGGAGKLSDEGQSLYWDISSNPPKRLAQLWHPRFVRAIAFSPIAPDEVAITSDFSAGVLETMNWRTGKTLRVFEGHSSKVISVAYSNEGDRLITGSDDRTLRFWDMNGGLRGTLHVGERIRRIITFPAGGFATASWEGTVRCYEPIPLSHYADEVVSD